jgi:photosystem II stability/assembly factor-like uncharacterized protein
MTFRASFRFPTPPVVPGDSCAAASRLPNRFEIRRPAVLRFALPFLLFLFGVPSNGADIAFMTANAGSLGTILKTTDGGTSWSAVYTGGSGTALRDIFAVDADTIYAVGDINLKSTDGGASWNQIFAGLSLNGVTAANANKVIAVGQGPSPQGRVIVSDNGGTSHTQVLITPPFASSTVFNRVDAVSATTAYLVGTYRVSSTDNSAIYKTTDGGASWTLQFNAGNAIGNAIDAASSNVAFGGTQATTGFTGTALKTSNGTTWASTAGTFSQLRAVAAWDENLVYVAGSGGQIQRSTNGASSWSNLSTGTARAFNDIGFLNQTSLIAVGDFGTVRRTVDSGTSWQDIAPAGYSSHLFTAVTTVPEPSTILLATIACGILAWKGRKSIR